MARPTGDRSATAYPVARRMGLLLAVLSCSACSPESIPVVLDFPSEIAFLKSDSAWVGVFVDQQCALALDVDYAGPDPQHESGKIPLCELYNDPSVVRIDDVTDDRFAIVALVHGGEEALVYLQGCQPYQGNEPVEIPLQPTMALLGDDSTPECDDIESRCRGDC